MDKLSPPTGYKMTLRDVVGVVVGGCVLAFPVAATEEVWKISETLPLGRVAYLIYSSLLSSACLPIIVISRDNCEGTSATSWSEYLVSTS
jgi:uncharacterized membrane protein